MREFFWKYDTSIKSFFIVVLLVLLMWVISIQRQLTYVPETSPAETLPIPVDACGEDCKRSIAEIVSESLATASASQKIVYIGSKQPESQQKVTYIPLNGNFSTSKTEWMDVRNSEVYIDLAEYSKDPYLDWEATIKAISGKAQARLFDVTHGIAVGESGTESTLSVFTTVSSGQINLWQGRNLYRVQLKSLDGSEVFFDSGKIKIVAK